MDPITRGLTVLQVVQTLAQASALLLGYVASVHGADSSCQNLLNELRSISGVLTTVMEIKDNASLPAPLCNALSCLMGNGGPLIKLQGELENLLPPDQESRKMGMRDKLAWPFKEKRAIAITDKLKGYCGEITKILVIDTWMTLKEVKLGVQGLIGDSAAQKVHDKGELLTASFLALFNMHRKERQDFLQWMNPVSCTDKHEASCCQRNPESGRWISHNDQYVAWNKSHSALLWLNGQPGHGKTILTNSSVIAEIQGSGEAESQTLAYFYCNFRDDWTTSAAAVLRSLVVQLLRESKDDWITEIRVDLNKLSSINPDLYNQHFIRDGFHAPISWAAAIGSEVAVDFLLLQQEVILPNDILHIAIMAQKPSHGASRTFCQHGADVNFTINGSTIPLHTLLSRHREISEDRS
ncbi:hypothetical protein EDB19DRAFT_2005933 [Suillus lakei]|nr:hypothetical protein EDB19DRAFT_2005933 [Suillus lakei]